MLDSIHSIRQTSTTKLEIFVSAYETVPISDVSRRGTAGHSREGQQGSRTRRLLEHPIVQGPVNDPQAFPPFSSVYPDRRGILNAICLWSPVANVWKLTGTPGSLVTIAAEGFGAMRN